MPAATRFYRDGRGVGTSFLELVRDRRLAAGRADPAALVEFLAHGAVLGSRTFASGVEELLYDEILYLPPGGGPPRLRAKVLPKAVPAEKRIVLENFAGLARSLEGRSFSADATGGFDSRLIVCLLAENKVPMELAISGMPGTPDTEIAREMARLLDRPLHLSGHDLTDLDDQLVATFRDGDGQTDLRRFHRDRQNAQARLARGVEVFSHGGGGELFRDHYVIQDFPFYGSSRVNYSRYYDFRMTPVPLPAAALSPKGQEHPGRPQGRHHRPLREAARTDQQRELRSHLLLPPLARVLRPLLLELHQHGPRRGGAAARLRQRALGHVALAVGPLLLPLAPAHDHRALPEARCPAVG